MCPYYAYTFSCGHTQTVFATWCAKAQISQRRCNTRTSSATISATLKFEEKCPDCLSMGGSLTVGPGQRR
ncbi:hypothetical protein EJ08DRAFT_650978 [Tothia fuscella]|uniref:Uncharacterized protein n=1 Tax=Tothia fuscella TaxID=1048955 RepID=A0A9P4NN76_9PEZI|nr:hypothetical protein EJ08DRAFT_650978 [Tothia fuscella]